MKLAAGRESNNAVRRWAEQRRSDVPREDDRPRDEERALEKLRAEADENGATLTSGGKGGLASSLVLGVMRRDKYRCKVDGDRGEGNKGGLQIHHVGGIVESPRLSRKGHRLLFNNLITICKQAHDRLHTKARKEGTDSSQVTPEGDKDEKED